MLPSRDIAARARRRLRRAALTAADHRAAAIVRRLPVVGERVARFSPPPGHRRIEVGSGFNPRPGYVHVDVRPGLPDLDVVAPADRLPFPAGWADEILAVHMIEHVPAGALPQVLGRWRQLLRPGGRLVLHTPNGAALGAALVRTDLSPAVAWAVQAAIYGYDRAPWDATHAEAVGLSPDHKLLFTPSLLRHALETAGFEQVADVSGRDPHCGHTRDWEPYVPGLCLEMTAVAPGGDGWS